jgi:hypothetical protein
VTLTDAKAQVAWRMGRIAASRRDRQSKTKG